MMCVAMPTTTTSASVMAEAKKEEDSTSPKAAKETNNNHDCSDEAVNDDLGSSDEVKVFNDEDERDADPSESYQAELQAEKSSLIHESEQGKNATSSISTGIADKEDLHIFRAHHHEDLSPAALAVPGMAASFGMASYFVNPYAAYAASNGSHVARTSTGSPLSQFLYGGPPPPPPQPPGDPLASPPPAHVGLRSPLYSLPHTQYPYSMLGAADQLAAWHHQASVYHQAGALRSSSPYSLPPITTASFSSFSPSSLLGSSHSGHHHLPHLKADYDTSPIGGGSGGVTAARKESRQKQKKETHIKKPLNAFMLYMKEMRPVVQAECTLKESAAINQLLGRRWHGLTREEQAKYYEKARVERQKHMQMYPHWNARDNYRFGVKKKKRKRERSVEAPASSASNSMKKCRARFGLDQHNLWCKPCSPDDGTSSSSLSEAVANLHEAEGNGGDMGLLASLPQAPIPQHEFASLTDCYGTVLESHQHQHHLHGRAQNEANSGKDHMGQNGIYSPEYISL